MLGIPHDPASRKMELYELVQMHKPPPTEKQYVIDRVIRSYGHTPLRTPPYMCELNPIEMIWAQLKRYIRSRNTTGEFTIKKLGELLQEAIASISPNDWKKCCHHVIAIEEKYWETDKYMEDVTEEIIISLGPEQDSASDSDSDHSNSGD